MGYAVFWLAADYDFCLCASTDWSERERADIPRGPAGIGTRLLIQFLINRSL